MEAARTLRDLGENVMIHRYGNFVSGSTDTTLRLWDARTGETIRIFEGHTNSVRCVTALGYGTNFISGSSDGTLRLWDNRLQPIQQPRPEQLSRNIPRGSTNMISFDDIQEGNAMINFPRNNTKTEYNYKSYLKNTPYLRGLRKNPFSRKNLIPTNFTHYTAHLVNAQEGNTQEGNAQEGNAQEGNAQEGNTQEGGKGKKKRSTRKKRT